MNAKLKGPIRGQLQDRRRRLVAAIEDSGDSGDAGDAGDMIRLLGEVDSALARLDAGGFGGCEVCGGEVDDDILLSNPLARYCLCDLSEAQTRALEQDMGLASRIQLALLPKQDVQHAGWDTHYRYEPAGAVSGDYCDLIPRGDGSSDASLLFVLGDVSGKGFAASLLMAHLNAAFRSLVSAGMDVDQIVSRANTLLVESRISSHYATLVCGRADASGDILITNAGHCPPLVVREKDVSAIGATGFPVGMFGEEPFTTTRVRLDPGDLLFIYTDGLTEARSRDGLEYGTDRLIELLRACRTESAGRIAARAVHDVGEFLDGEARADDLTILVIRRSG